MKETKMIRGFSPAVTVAVFLLLWLLVYGVMRYVAPEISKTQFKAMAISFGVAIAALLTVLIAFSILANFG